MVSRERIEVLFRCLSLRYPNIFKADEDPIVLGRVDQNILGVSLWPLDSVTAVHIWPIICVHLVCSCTY